MRLRFFFNCFPQWSPFKKSFFLTIKPEEAVQRKFVGTKWERNLYRTNFFMFNFASSLLFFEACQWMAVWTLFFFCNRLDSLSPRSEPSLEQEISLIFTYTMGKVSWRLLPPYPYRKVVLCGKQKRQQTQNKLSSNVREAGLTGYFDSDALLASSEQGIFDT